MTDWHFTKSHYAELLRCCSVKTVVMKHSVSVKSQGCPLASSCILVLFVVKNAFPIFPLNDPGVEVSL